MKVKLADLDLSALPDILENANKRFAENERRSFARTVNNWENKPDFTRRVTKNTYGIKDFEIFTANKIYFWVNFGTDLHEITPKEDGYSLRFNEFYDPKTEPGRIVSKGTGRRFGEVVYRTVVEQQIEPRRFDLEIRKNAVKRWSNALNTELKKHLKKVVK